MRGLKSLGACVFSCTACIAAKLHPFLSSTVATCTACIAATPQPFLYSTTQSSAQRRF